MSKMLFMTHIERDHLVKIGEEMEEYLMFGNIENQKSQAKEAVKRLFREKKIIFSEAKSILKMINSSAQDNFDFAKTLIQTLSNKQTCQ